MARTPTIAPMSTTRITPLDVSDMVKHWLGCPPNGYLGLRYGSDVKSLLQTPMATGLADSLIAKCREDVPLLQGMGAGAVNVYSYDRGMDHKVIAFEVAGQLVESGGQEFASQGAEPPFVDARNGQIAGGLTGDGLNQLHRILHVALPSTNYF